MGAIHRHGGDPDSHHGEELLRGRRRRPRRRRGADRVTSWSAAARASEIKAAAGLLHEREQLRAASGAAGGRVGRSRDNTARARGRLFTCYPFQAVRPARETAAEMGCPTSKSRASCGLITADRCRRPRQFGSTIVRDVKDRSVSSSVLACSKCPSELVRVFQSAASSYALQRSRRPMRRTRWRSEERPVDRRPRLRRERERRRPAMSRKAGSDHDG